MLRKKRTYLMEHTQLVFISEDGVKMISRDFVEESEIFHVEIELTQIANKHGYEVK